MRLVKFMMVGVLLMVAGTAGILALTAVGILVGSAIARVVGVTNPDLTIFMGLWVVIGAGGGAFFYWMEDDRWTS